MLMVRLIVKSKNASELMTIINGYLPEKIRFQEKDLFTRQQLDDGRVVIEAEKKFKEFPMNEIYQKIVDESSLWMPGDNVRAVYLERIDPITREVRAYFDFQPAGVMKETMRVLRLFVDKNLNVDNSEKSTVNKEKGIPEKE